MSNARVDTLKKGDQFVWAGRLVTVHGIEEAVAPEGEEPGRWVQIEEDEAGTRLFLPETAEVSIP